MILTEPQLRAFVPNLPAYSSWVAALVTACSRFEITTPPRLAAFLAQTAHESAEFLRLIENLNYSAEGLKATWPSRFPTLEAARPYARNPEKIANYVYANRLGNGPQESGDGFRFRGRGLIQLTGRSNYRDAGMALQMPLEDEPYRVGEPNVAALTAAHFWNSRGLNGLADVNTPETFDKITKRINGGMHGHVARRAYWARAKAALAL